MLMISRGLRTNNIRHLFRGFAAGAVVATSVIATIDLANANERVVIGTPGNLSDNSLAVKVALDEGLYKEAGLDVEIVNFKGGAPSIQALVGGGVQYAIAAPEHVTRLHQRGVSAVVSFALQSTHTYALVAPADSPVKSFADLKGKRIGITSAGSLTENLIRLQSLDSGLTFGKDIQVLGVGVGAAQKAALDTQRIDAGMFGNIDALELERDGYRIVYDWRTHRIPGLALLALKSYEDENPAIAEAIVKATLKGQRLVLENRDLTVSKLKELYPNYSDQTINGVADRLQNSLQSNGLFEREPFEKLQEELVLIEPDLEKVDYDTANPGTYLK